MRKRHHYVPKTYLRRFANQKNQVRAYRRTDRKHVARMSITNAAVESGFYLTEDHSGQVTDDAEKLLNWIESETAPALESVSRGRWPPTTEARNLIANFAAIQATRTREHLHSRHGMARAFADFIVQSLTAEGETEVSLAGGPPIPLDQLHAEFETDRTDDVQSMFDLAASLVPVFYQRSWTLLKTKKRLFLATDNPVITAQLNPGDDFRGVGFGNADSVVMPIDPTRAIVMWKTSPDAEPADLPVEIEVRPSTARGLSEYLAAWSYEWLFCDPRSKVFSDIQLPRGPRSLGTLSGFGRGPTEVYGPGHGPDEG